MSSTFTPLSTFDVSKERDWPVDLGMLDWDSTSIVFTKRSLIEFLKYTGTTVDPNFTNIGKLPRYAKFGKISKLSGSNALTGSSDVPIAESDSAADPSDFKSSHRVRSTPGGSHSDIFGHDDEGDALSLAPPRLTQHETANQSSSTNAAAASEEIADEDNGIDFGSSFKPTRRVRTAPGGKSSLSNFWDPAETETFKPTRRVRQGPGGQDNINEIF